MMSRCMRYCVVSAVHAVLGGEECNALRFALGHFLHECLVESTAGGFGTFDGGRQLEVVATEYDAVCLEDSGPAGSLYGLGGLVDEKRAETVSPKQPMCAADEGAGDHLRLLQHLFVYFHFQLVTAFLETSQAVGAPA